MMFMKESVVEITSVNSSKVPESQELTEKFVENATKVVINGKRYDGGSNIWSQARGSKRISIFDLELPIQENFEIRINVY